MLPFVVFLILLAIHRYLPFEETVEFALRIAILTTVLWIFSRKVIDLRVSSPVFTLLVGIGVFVIWIAPDVLWPGYRSHWLFSNSITGAAQSSLTTQAPSPLLIALRTIRAVILVPMIEELFWRAWLLRYLINPRFESVPLGTFQTSAFWITAALFAAEHGPYWDVGLITGLIYNWWMVRTKRVGDLILAHAVTNGCLCAYVIATHRWEYWL